VGVVGGGRVNAGALPSEAPPSLPVILSQFAFFKRPGFI
jgi:hypothetical protein